MGDFDVHYFAFGLWTSRVVTMSLVQTFGMINDVTLGLLLSAWPGGPTSAPQSANNYDNYDSFVLVTAGNPPDDGFTRAPGRDASCDVTSIPPHRAATKL